MQKHLICEVNHFMSEPVQTPKNTVETPESIAAAKAEEAAKLAELARLAKEVPDYFLKRYMKVSPTLIDLKIRVCKERIAGKTPPQIGPDWETIQEVD